MLIKCKECGHEISDKASVCPNCGYPVEQLKETHIAAKKPKTQILKTIWNESHLKRDSESVQALKIGKMTRKIEKIQTSHVLHLLLSVITAGIWIPVWLLIAISNGMERSTGERALKKYVEQQAKYKGGA